MFDLMPYSIINVRDDWSSLIAVSQKQPSNFNENFHQLHMSV